MVVIDEIGIYFILDPLPVIGPSFYSSKVNSWKLSKFLVVKIQNYKLNLHFHSLSVKYFLCLWIWSITCSKSKKEVLKIWCMCYKIWCISKIFKNVRFAFILWEMYKSWNFGSMPRFWDLNFICRSFIHTSSFSFLCSSRI